MKNNLDLARVFMVVLALVTIGRFALGVRGVPYETGTHLLSIVVVTMLSSLYHGAFARRFRGYSLLQSAGLGLTLGLIAQVVILLATAASYAFDIPSYFNDPRALNVPAPIGFGDAMLRRLAGLVANSLFNGIVGGLGWALGGLLPQSK